MNAGDAIDPDAFDLRTLPEGFYADPYPTYRALRERDPVHRMPDGSWFLTRYADCLRVYRDHAVMRSDKREEFGPKFGEGGLYDHHTTSLVFRDPPQHTRVRRLLHHCFTPRALAIMEPRVVALVDAMLDRIEEEGRCDLVDAFASALPVEVVCDILGVPREDRGTLRDWARLILGALEPSLSEAQLARGNAAVAEFSAYLGSLIAHKRRHGGADDADLLDTMLRAVDSGTEGIDEFELIQNCIFLLNAGHETTTNLIANGVHQLLARRECMDAVRADPALMDTGVDELLRLESSNQLGNRRAIEDCEVGGVSLPAGSLVTLCIGAANRDPAQFPDPDELALDRSPNRHLAFAAGIHTCAGANLARIEGRIAITRLLQRFPDLQADGPVERDPRVRFRVVRRLPVRV